ncbi:unnamed protein product, partial [Ectocarpus sp. 4 AP-2014]
PLVTLSQRSQRLCRETPIRGHREGVLHLRQCLPCITLNHYSIIITRGECSSTRKHTLILSALRGHHLLFCRLFRGLRAKRPMNFSDRNPKRSTRNVAKGLNVPSPTVKKKNRLPKGLFF